MKCDMCENDADIHVVETQSDDTAISRHFCRVHAREAGFNLPNPEDSVDGLVPTLRSLAKFCRLNNRMPTPDEMAQFSACGNLTNTLAGTPDFERQVAYLEDFATFIDKHGRLPTDQEIPDPF